MLLFGYVKRKPSIHIIICFIYSILFLMQILLVGELCYEKGLNDYKLGETSYNFVVKNVNTQQMTDICSDTKMYMDLCLIYNFDDISLVCYPNGISNKRETDIELDKLTANEVYSQYGAAYNVTTDLKGNVIDITKYHVNNIDLKVIGSVYVDDSFRGNNTNKIYCNFDTFISVVPVNAEIIVSVLADKPLDGEEVNHLKEIVRGRFGVFEYLSPIQSHEQIRFLLSSEMGYLVTIMFLISFSFSRLMWTILQRREEEYRILRICGASNNKIDLYKILHLLFIISISIILGIVLFLGTRICAGSIFVYTRDSLFFYALNIFMFYLLAIITVFTNKIIEKRAFS